MALPFGVSWIFMLLWGCIYFPPQNGYKITHGYYLYKSPQTSSQFNSGESSEANYEDETKAMGQQSFVSQQTEPVSYGNGHQVSPVKSFSDTIVQGHPDSAYTAGKFFVAHPDKSSNEVWGRRTANHQVPGELHSFTAPVSSTANVMSSSVYGNQMLSPRSARYLDNHAAATIGLISNNVPHGTPLVGNNIFLGASKKQYVQSSYNQPQQTVSPFGPSVEHSFGGHKSASPFNPPNNPSQDFSYFSWKPSHSTPSTYEPNSFKPKYVPHKKHPPRGYPKPSGGFEHDKGLFSATWANVLYPQKPPSLNSYIPGSELSTPNPASKYKDKTYQASGGKRSKTVYYTPPIHQPASSGSVLSLSNPSPQSRGHIAFQTSDLHKPQHQDNSHLVFGIKPDCSPHASSRDYTYSGYQKTVDPSILAAQTDDENKPEFNNRKLIPALREPNEKAITRHRGTDLTRKKISHRSRNQPNSLSAQDGFLYLNGGYHEAMKAGLIKTANQPPDPQMFPASLNKGPIKLDSWPSAMLPESKGTGGNCVVWHDSNHHPQKFHKSSRSPVNTYVKSKNRSARATVYMSKTCFKPQMQAQGKAAKRQWKFAVRRT